MQEYQKLNSYVLNLQNCESSEYDSLFSEFYRELTLAWSSGGDIQSMAYTYKIDEDDVLSIASFKAYELVGKFDASRGDFYNLLSNSVSRKLKDEVNKRNKHAETHVASFETSMEDDPNMIPYIPHSNAEDEAIESFQKKSEQLQLLTQLLEKADEKSHQAVLAFSESQSYLDASKRLGISNHAVKRRVEKVSKLFDEKEYGSIYDYFTVPTSCVKSA